MKLSEFVEQTLVDICQGVEDAKSKTSMAIAPGSLNGKTLDEVQYVGFTVAVTTEKAAGGGIKIFSADFAGDVSHQNMNQINFEIPIIFNAYIKDKIQE